MVDSSVEDEPQLYHGLGLFLLGELCAPSHVVQERQPYLIIEHSNASTSVVESNTLTLDPDPGFWHNLDPDPGFWHNLYPDPWLCYRYKF